MRYFVTGEQQRKSLLNTLVLMFPVSYTHLTLPTNREV